MASFLFLIIVLFVLYSLFNKSETTGNWSHLFANMQHDPEDFYKLVEANLAERQVPDFKTDRKTFKQGGLLSYSRIYLEVSRGDFIFHICAAPWGTGFFFSSWTRKKENTIGEVLAKLPIVGGFFAALNQSDSYYKLDTDAMFKASVHQSILSAIDQLTEAKGIRGLTEMERTADLRSILK